MKKALLLVVLFAALSLPAHAENISLLTKDADSLYTSRETLSSCEKSIELYEKVLAVDSKEYDACWKISRSCKFLGDRLPNDDRVTVLEKGEKYARRAIEIKPDKVEGHFWLGVCLGRIGEERGVLNSLFLVGPIRDEMEKCLAIDPTYDGAHHVLGVLFRKAPGWPLSSGDINKAEEHALLAVKYGPNRTLNHLGLAEVYIARDENKEAREQLNIVINLPLEPDRVPEDKDDKARAAELLKEVNKKLGEK